MPEVTIVIAAYNEESVVREKMQNCNEFDYPKELLKICWVTDGSNDSTNNILSEFPNVEILFQPERKGKSAALNRAMPLIKTPIAIFTDANTMVNPQAIKEIIKEFTDLKVGCVAGEKKVLIEKGKNAAAGEGIYWKYESKLKELDYRLYSAVGAAGELFAVRTELFIPLKDNILLDDFILSMKIAERGYKIAYCKDAYAMEEPSFNMKEENKRKVRIAAGGLQSIIILYRLLNPLKYPILSFQYISHRVLRWSLTPIALFTLLPLNIYLCLMDKEAYFILLILQILFYISALIGKINAEKNIKNKLFFIPYYFISMNINIFRGIRYLINRKGSGAWEKAKRAV